jgi:hypothetical protein
MRARHFCLNAGLAIWLTAGAMAAPPPLPFGGLSTRYAYVELVEMSLAAPLAIAATVDRAERLKGAAATGVPAGTARYLVTAQVSALVAGSAALPPVVTYLIDLPDPGRTKPKLKGVPVLLLAAPGPRPGELRLIGPRGQVPRTPENEARVRSVLAEKISPAVPPPVTGVSRAFHVAGSLPGEGETQIFLRTRDSRPMALNVLRRPGEKPRWAVALTEMIDDSAAPPKADTLLWYRLACGLPATLSADAVAENAPADAEQARADYQLIRQELGPCTRAP